ncbi:hypothetical protein ACFL4U_03110 [Candidatus Neomarinimicrobiota bacterium]
MGAGQSSRSGTATEIYTQYPEQYLAQVFGDGQVLVVDELANEVQQTGERLAFQA